MSLRRTNLSDPKKYVLMCTLAFLSISSTKAYGQSQTSNIPPTFPSPDKGLSDDNGVSITNASPDISVSDVSVGGDRPLTNYFRSSFNCEFQIQTCPHFRQENFIPNRLGNFMPALVGGTSSLKRDFEQISGQGILLPFSLGNVNETFITSPCDSPGELIGLEYQSFTNNGGRFQILSYDRAIYTSKNGDVYTISSSINIPQPDLPPEAMSLFRPETPPPTTGCGLYWGNLHPVTKIEYADGRTINLNYTKDIRQVGRFDLTSVVRSDGFALKYQYENGRLVRTVGVNLAWDECSGVSQTCSAAYDWPTARYEWTPSVNSNNFESDSYGGKILSITHPSGETETVRLDIFDRVVERTYPSGAAMDYKYCEINIRTGHTRNCENFYGGIGAAGYLNLGKLAYLRFKGNDNWFTYSATEGPVNFFTSYDLYSSSDSYHEISENATFKINDYQQIRGVSYTKRRDGTECWLSSNTRNDLRYCSLNGVETHYTFDARGNLAAREVRPRGGGTPLVTTNTYAASCNVGNQKTCNRPQAVTDPSGKVTNFVYDPIHGGVLKATLPPNANGVRAETRYSYSQHHAWIKSGTSFVRQAPMWLLDAEEYCRTSASDSNGNCAAGAADKVVTSYQYEQGGGSKGSNLLLLGVAVTADGVNYRTCYRYDKLGRKISETQPNANLASCS